MMAIGEKSCFDALHMHHVVAKNRGVEPEVKLHVPVSYANLNDQAISEAA